MSQQYKVLYSLLFLPVVFALLNDHPTPSQLLILKEMQPDHVLSLNEKDVIEVPKDRRSHRKVMVENIRDKHRMYSFDANKVEWDGNRYWFHDQRYHAYKDLRYSDQWILFGNFIAATGWILFGFLFTKGGPNRLCFWIAIAETVWMFVAYLQQLELWMSHPIWIFSTIVLTGSLFIACIQVWLKLLPSPSMILVQTEEDRRATHDLVFPSSFAQSVRYALEDDGLVEQWKSDRRDRRKNLDRRAWITQKKGNKRRAQSRRK